RFSRDWSSDVCSSDLVARIDGFAIARARALHEGHVDWHFHLEDVHSVLGLREFFHAAGNNLGLLTGEVDTLFVDVLFVTDELEEKRHVDGGAFGADALDPGMLGFVDGGRIEGRVVKQDFDAIRPGSDQTPDRKLIEQIRQANGLRTVDYSHRVRDTHAGILC